MKAWLFRKKGPAWEFTSEFSGSFYHKTKKGTDYAIHYGPSCGKPLWVARLIKNSTGTCWITVESELQAQCIKFENGDEYWFSKYTKGNCYVVDE